MIETIKKHGFLCLIYLFLSCAEGNSQISNLELDEFVEAYKSTENAQLLDLRTEGEWENGVLENSIKINFRGTNFAEEIKQLNPDKPLFIYCAGGGRSAQASTILANSGFKVFNLMNAGYGHLADKELE